MPPCVCWRGLSCVWNSGEESHEAKRRQILQAHVLANCGDWGWDPIMAFLWQQFLVHWWQFWFLWWSWTLWRSLFRSSSCSHCVWGTRLLQCLGRQGKSSLTGILSTVAYFWCWVWLPLQMVDQDQWQQQSIWWIWAHMWRFGQQQHFYCSPFGWTTLWCTAVH